MLKNGEVLYNKVKWMLKDGKRTIGSWLQLGSNISAEIVAKAGPDWVMIDMEHGPYDIPTLTTQLQAIAKYDVVPLARAPWNDFVAIKQLLDCGVMGILVPYVSTKQEAERAVQACKYPVEGIRGVAGSPRAAGFGMDGTRYLSNINEQILVMTQVETPQAVENIEELVTVDGLDGIFIGPMDLSCSMGHFADPKNPEVQAAIHRVEDVVLKSDKFLATVANNIQDAEALYKRGYRLVVPMSDSTALGKMAKDTFETFHKMFPER